jgi:hypothetical protein
MWPNVEDRHRSVLFLLGDVGAGHSPPVYHVGRAGAQHPKAFFLLDDDRGVLVQPDAQEARVLRDGAEQAPGALSRFG